MYGHLVGVDHLKVDSVVEVTDVGHVNVLHVVGVDGHLVSDDVHDHAVDVDQGLVGSFDK